MHALAATLLLTAVLGGCAASNTIMSTRLTNEPSAQPQEATMELGAFSVSLTVKDIAASRAFYEQLGFTVVGGEQAQNWLVLRNGTANIGLFQGMFEKNMLTFNPGWTNTKEAMKKFQDVRALQQTIKGTGITPVTEADETTTGPASFVVVDPDGNPILVDQHVDSPASG